MLRIAVQAKGRLYEETMTMLAESSIKIDAAKRTLLVPAKNFPVEILYLRDDDIPQAVAGGTADVGIVGENEFEERQEDAQIIKRLDFSKCRLSIAIPERNLEEYNKLGNKWLNGKKIATSYPGILKRFLEKNSLKADIHVITGSVEIAPGIGLADCIFDIVSSGATLVSNNLKEVEVVMKSEAILIANKNISAEKQEILNEILFRFDSYKNAEGKKYIVLNIPNEKISEATTLLPGMKAPTITRLETEGWSSMASVVSEKDFWDIIGKLKQLGAESILVMPIEKMIL
ncbi:MAG: ATP phosphoribosyltransferase [Bacteroidales bacterium]|nr:ATP phosphoribosyltransferase [Bacteroidales bacterium]